MEKEFVTYELALKLKELGFNKPCILEFHNGKSLPNYCGDFTINSNLEEIFNNVISQPTFSQAFRWFREKHQLRISIIDFLTDEDEIEWDYEIVIIGTDVNERGEYEPLVDYSIDDENRQFKTYEEAELSCLEKLIEIVENKK